MKVGDLYWVELPAKKDHEQKGYRPVIVVVIHQDVSLTTVIPLTSSEKAKPYKNTMIILPDDENNLVKPSVALIFQMLAVDNKMLKKR